MLKVCVGMALALERVGSNGTASRASVLPKVCMASWMGIKMRMMLSHFDLALLQILVIRFLAQWYWFVANFDLVW